jgi:hypothetical protein
MHGDAAGFVTLPDRRPGGVAVHPDGIVVAGQPTTPERALFLLRLDFDGELDDGFGSGGVVTEDGMIGVPPGAIEPVHPDPYVCNGAVLIADDGDIVVGFGFDDGAYSGAAAVRYDASGAPDAGFVGNEYFRMSLSPLRGGFGLAPVGGTCVDVALDGAGGIVFGATVEEMITPMV